MTAKTEQSKRFEEAARAAGCDETGEAFERAFGVIVPPKHRDKAKEPDSAKERKLKP